jgi:hypothetical protein
VIIICNGLPFASLRSTSAWQCAAGRPVSDALSHLLTRYPGPGCCPTKFAGWWRPVPHYLPPALAQCLRHILGHLRLQTFGLSIPSVVHTVPRPTPDEWDVCHYEVEASSYCLLCGYVAAAHLGPRARYASGLDVTPISCHSPCGGPATLEGYNYLDTSVSLYQLLTKLCPLF